MQADTLGVLAETDGFVEGRLVFLDSRTTYINEFQGTALVEVVDRWRERPQAGIGNDTVGEREAMGFDVMAQETFTDVLRRTLEISIIIVEYTTPVPVEHLTNEITAFVTETVKHYILRVYVIRACDGLA